MKKLITLALGLLFAIGLSGLAIAGSLDSPGAPSAGSGMYTLQNLYDYLTSGTALTVQTSFQEPASGPTAGTMKTTKEIGDGIKAQFDLCDATADKVASGTRFFSTAPGSWGVRTGTAQLVPTPTPTSTATLTPTITPTPTWGASQCLALGGFWYQDGVGGDETSYGCWYEAADSNTTCTQRCALVPGLHCLATDWNDQDCGACLNFPGHSGLSGCSLNESRCDQPASRHSANTCYGRKWPQESAQGCDCSYGAADLRRMCVCVP